MTRMGELAHLMPEVVDIFRGVTVTRDGIRTVEYQLVSGQTDVPCRLDVGFLRPGKDAAPPVQAGRVPDRVAVYFLELGTDLRAGDQIRSTSGPVGGWWAVRSGPDVVVGFALANHLEGQVIEVTVQS